MVRVVDVEPLRKHLPTQVAALALTLAACSTTPKTGSEVANDLEGAVAFERDTGKEEFTFQRVFKAVAALGEKAGVTEEYLASSKMEKIETERYLVALQDLETRCILLEEFFPLIDRDPRAFDEDARDFVDAILLYTKDTAELETVVRTLGKEQMLGSSSHRARHLAVCAELLPKLANLNDLPECPSPLLDRELAGLYSALMERHQEIQKVLEENSSLQRTNLWRQLNGALQYSRAYCLTEMAAMKNPMEEFPAFYRAEVIKDRMLRNFGLSFVHSELEEGKEIWDAVGSTLNPRFQEKRLRRNEDGSVSVKNDERKWTEFELLQCEKYLEKATRIALPKGRILFAEDIHAIYRCPTIRADLFGLRYGDGEIEIFDPDPSKNMAIGRTFVHELVHGVCGEDRGYLRYLIDRDNWKQYPKPLSSVSYGDVPTAQFIDGSSLPLDRPYQEAPGATPKMPVFDESLFRIMTYDYRDPRNQFPPGFNTATLYNHLPVQLVLTRVDLPSTFRDSTSEWGRHLRAWIGTP
ncbi:MAG: hypothetical protein KDD70_06790 [Bdellovibrionales bacterium]|nr:hypothetical protein [Bdellovibrionales bacterium]